MRCSIHERQLVNGVFLVNRSADQCSGFVIYRRSNTTSRFLRIVRISQCSPDGEASIDSRGVCWRYSKYRFPQGLGPSCSRPLRPGTDLKSLELFPLKEDLHGTTMDTYVISTLYSPRVSSAVARLVSRRHLPLLPGQLTSSALLCDAQLSSTTAVLGQAVVSPSPNWR